jgi:hypothetical protein
VFKGISFEGIKKLRLKGGIWVFLRKKIIIYVAH